ncbi:threonine dehydratase [Clostridium cavendishii DSM 21758]|uniref:L-threonine dehydratase catabolic TdcB n=1 Tax=Clostridium cavendishii DSM 21758 TaxID=1121302 RepID=A0A1M6B9X6_9CLOT|nr:threonine ammonia-lyase [Clostridium cavendishii]SHI45554.1 threonine dehydratase [Clostridium cavendishii DSM 21758]
MYLNQFKKARINLKNIVVETPLIFSEIFSSECCNNVYMKCENLQLTGAYKIRGALNKISTLSEEDKAKGVVCSSAGNHAQGVAYASKLFNVKSKIVMPKTTPLIKIQNTKNFGGNVVLFGNVYDDAYNEARRIEQEEHSIFIHPFNDLEVIFGQGTIALEILEQLNDIDIILCPIGGGGLISGISLVCKALKPSIKIIGVQASGANSMELSFKKGSIVNLPSVNTIADGIAVKNPGTLTYEFIKNNVDDIITVDDSDIVESFILLLEKHKLLAEASGVVSLAALKKLNTYNKNIVSIISGGNIDMLTISSLINSGLVSRGRLFCFDVELPNKPGQLVEISELLSSLRANIVQLEHNQFKATDRLKNILLEVTVEANGENHIQVIKKALINAGYTIRTIY